VNSKKIDENLRKFQLFILKARNAECLINKYGGLEQLVYEINRLNIKAEMKNWTQFKYLNQSIGQKYSKDMVDKFNELVN
jgi:hypothetical protein